MYICEPFQQTSGDIAKMWCQKHLSLSLFISLKISLSLYLYIYIYIYIYITLDNRFLKILVVIGHVCIYWSKVAEGFSVFNAVLFLHGGVWPFGRIDWSTGLWLLSVLSASMGLLDATFQTLWSTLQQVATMLQGIKRWGCALNIAADSNQDTTLTVCSSVPWHSYRRMTTQSVLFQEPGAVAMQDIHQKRILNSNLAKYRLPVTFCSVAKSI